MIWVLIVNLNWILNPMTNVELSIKCIQCKKHHTLSIPRKDYVDWIDGVLIQNAMPYLSAEQRELLISKICGVCFIKVFGER